MTPIGGSDWHGHAGIETLGSPTTWIAVDADAAGPDELVGAVLDGLRSGRTAVSADLSAPVMLPMGGQLVVLGAAGALLIGSDGHRTVRAERETLPAIGRNGHMLIDHDGAAIAVAGASRDTL